MEFEDIPQSPTHFVPMRRPPGSRQPQNRAPRPHSIGASIISNPKLVKGWTYYDNSPHPKSIQKYFSTINLPPGPPPSQGEATSSSDVTSTGGSRRVAVPTAAADELEVAPVPRENDAMIGVEIKACVAEDEDEGLCHHFLGIILTILGSSSLALVAVLVKYVAEYRHHHYPYAVSVWSFQGLLVPSLVVYLLSRGWKVTRSKSEEELRIAYLMKRESSSCRRLSSKGSLVVLRGVFGWICVVLEIEALQRLGNNDHGLITEMIIFIFPVFVVIAAWISLRERVSFISIITTIVVVFGVSLILRPGKDDFEKKQWFSYVMSIGSLVLTILCILIIRRVREVHFALINLVFGLIGTVGGIFLCIWKKEFEFLFPEGRTWFLALSIAGLTFVGYSLLTLALKHEEAGTVAIVMTWEIPVTFFIGALYLKESIRPNMWSFIGAAVIILGVLIILIRKWVEVKPKSRNLRRLLGFLLI